MKPTAQGVQYIEGTPASTPVLRVLRQPIYDSEFVVNGDGFERLFVNNATFAAGGAKTIRDTNLTQPRSLGTPLEFDLVGFNVELFYGTPLADVNVIYNGGSFQFDFGQNTQWLQVPLTRIPQGVGQIAAFDGTLGGAVVVNQGLPQTNQIYNFSTADRKARRIQSNENFAVTINHNPAVVGLAGNVRLTAYLQGILYAQL